MIDNKLRITAGNTFATAHTITALDVQGQPIPDFDLQECTDIQVYARNGGSYKQVTSWQLDDQSVVVLWYGKQMKLGGYDFYIAGKFNGADWRTSEATIFEIVQYNEEANIPDDTIVVSGTYFIDASFSLITEMQGGGGGATPSSTFPLMDGEASVGTENAYARGDHRHPSDTNKQDVITDLETIRSGAAEGATALQPSALTGYATETYVGNAVSGEATRAENAEGLLQDAIDAIEAVIPSAASSSNQLADKAFVNSSIATNTATFKGTYNSLAELQQVTATNNDYAFVIETDALGNEYYDRYKYNGSAWLYEYKVESTPFTAAQWAAIQSGITSTLVTKIGTALQPTDIIDSLSSGSTTSALSANQGKVLNESKQATIDATHKLSADLVDDASTTNKFVTASEKTTWNGKESTSNKVTSLSSSSTDTQYPSAKCVYDLVGDIETLLSSI